MTRCEMDAGCVNLQDRFPTLRGIMDVLRGNVTLTAGLVIFFTLFLITILAPVIAPHDPAEQDLGNRFASPTPEYPLGTDQFGRCIFSRTVYGGQISLAIAVISTVACVLIGILVGMYAGYYPRLDAPLMRMTDIFLAFPAIVLALPIIAIVGPTPLGIILAILLPGWAKFARVIRSSTLSVKSSGFVEASKAAGATDTHILFRHILPNCYGPIIEIATLGLGSKIITITSLGFLGLGVQPPIPEWGTMINQGLTMLEKAPMIALSAGSMIVLFVLATNLIGSELRKIIDPRSDTIVI
ncbi:MULTISPECIES: ABC transporter permease [unclassified Methanoregula]|uniref:ABC transporter permease n=1 Tax=unclassified Methanoregula TaxID=2649730 RepID=UPI0025CCCEDD|nr:MULTISPECIES: ABC transporter permease [unclassified Methanoregula]